MVELCHLIVRKVDERRDGWMHLHLLNFSNLMEVSLRSFPMEVASRENSANAAASLPLRAGLLLV